MSACPAILLARPVLVTLAESTFVGLQSLKCEVKPGGGLDIAYSYLDLIWIYSWEADIDLSPKCRRGAMPKLPATTELASGELY